MIFRLATCLSVLSASSAVTVDPSARIKAAIDPIVAAMAQKYNCSVSVALQGARIAEQPAQPIEVAVAAGVTDRSSGRPSQTSDSYVWGSVTKLVTGVGVLRLVDQKQISLRDSIPQHIDPLLKKMAAKDPTQNYTSLEELWGAEVYKITVEDLLGMRSGVPDFDTASPTGKEPSDFFRAEAYAHPSQSFSPVQLLSLPWVRTGKLQFAPGVCDSKKYYNCYSSSNFVLLGLLLAHHAGASGWKDYQQQQALSPVTGDFAHLQFAVAGPPSAYTPVKGYDTTHYNNNTGAIDVSQMCGVLGGWSASDLVTDATGAAALVQDVYGPNYKLVSKPLVDEMYAQSEDTGYGLATFNLTHLTPNDVAYRGPTYWRLSFVSV